MAIDATPRTTNGSALDGDVATVGITEHAQNALGDIVFVELPEIGRKVEQGGEAARWSSPSRRRATSIAPVAGEVVEVNDALDGDAGARSTRMPRARAGSSG